MQGEEKNFYKENSLNNNEKGFPETRTYEKDSYRSGDNNYNDTHEEYDGEDYGEDNYAYGDGGRKKRRSKNDLDGRTFKCKHCEKTYLSEIALNNHVKNKHSHLVEIVSRGRGRPRKTSQAPENLQNPPPNDEKFKIFFENMLRQPVEDKTIDVVKASNENFNNIYTKYKEKLFADLEDPEKYPLINCKEPNQEEATIDYAFWKYIEFCSEKTNRDYFDFLFKFVVLFREYLNQSNERKEYTIENNAEAVPDCCNDFVSEFMESNDYFGLDINELIEVIQHCCYWLWENHHTTSRLSLVG